MLSPVVKPMSRSMVWPECSHSLPSWRPASSRPRASALLAIGLLVCKAGLAQNAPETQQQPTVPDAAPFRPQAMQPRFSESMPMEISELGLPEAFVWVGSRTLGTSSSAHFRASLSPDLARAVAQTALTEAGWKVDSMSFLARVFVDAYRPDPVRACRDDRWITVTASGAPGSSEVIFGMQPDRRRACDSSEWPDSFDARLVAELPSLEAPTDPPPADLRPSTRLAVATVATLPARA